MGFQEEDVSGRGWRNWHTWNANLWLNNDPASFRAAYNSRDDLKEWFTVWFGAIDGIDLDEVDWQEIREALEE